MGKIDILEEEESLEEVRVKTPWGMMTVEEIMDREGVIPQVRCKSGVCFESSEPLFELSPVSTLLKKDYGYFKQYRRYNKAHHFVLEQEPFSYMYEKKCWEFNFFDKLFLLLGRGLRNCGREPFNEDGVCCFFEWETLYSPSKCEVYLYRSYEIMKNNFERFRRAAVSFNADNFDSPLFREIIDDSSMVNIPERITIKGSVVSVLKGGKMEKDEIPNTNIDRSSWPSEFLKPSESPFKCRYL